MALARMQAGGQAMGGSRRPSLPSTPPLATPPPQTIDAFRSNLASLRQGLQAAVRDVQAAVLDRMEALQAEWQPTLDRLDVA